MFASDGHGNPGAWEEVKRSTGGRRRSYRCIDDTTTRRPTGGDELNHTLILGGRSFPLDASLDRELLEREIADLARNGGGFVPVRLADGGRLSCLVTPGVPIAIEEAMPIEIGGDGEEPPGPVGRRLRAVPPPSSHAG
jgi:hypothetical protein